VTVIISWISVFRQTLRPGGPSLGAIRLQPSISKTAGDAI